MTIEKKAKAYDETLERAKQLLRTSLASDRRIIERILPELKENNNEWIEMIRQELKSYLDHKEVKQISESDAILQWIAWLEKQGEQKPNYCHHEVDLSECSEEYRKAYYDGWNNCNMQHSQCKSELDDVVKCLINGMKFYYEDNEEATWGTDKWSMPVKHIIEVLEKQGENKYADKVEPKFHKGDWITNGDYTWKIVQVKPLDYILQSQDGNIVDDTISHVDEQFHSFTIQDAKEGDVLALSYAFQNYILIYKGLHEKDFDTMMSVFCSYYVEENTYEDETDSFHAMNRGEIITPATKKQRDILIKAMNDAGYTFDFEKKELKEMEQEQDSINPSEYINDMGGNGCYLKNTARVSAWSEEDEKMVNDIIAAIDTLYYHGMVNWLKSLKERYTWKPSEEQIIALNNAVLLNEDHYNGAVLSTLLEQLKKL